MPYATTTFGTLKTRLSERLGDPSQTYYVETELGLYLTEALRTWGATTAYWRERGTFATVSGTSHYTLQDNLLSSGVALVGQSVTDRNLIQAIQYHFLESAASQSAWGGTEMFTLDDIRYAIQRARDQFLRDTGLVLTRSTMNMPPPPVATVQLDEDIIDVRRVVWRNSALSNFLLWRTDTWELSGGINGATWGIDPATPDDWSLSDTRPIEIRVAPPPIDVGTLELVTVNAGAALDPATDATILGIPDGLAWAVKWGAIADLLSSEGSASDPQRAAFAQQMYDLGVELALKAPVVTYGEINGSPVFPTSLAEIDAAYPNWQDTPGTPEDIAIAGPNLVYIRSKPDGVYSVVLDVVRNAPIPDVDGDFIQVGNEELNAILDYAQVLAAFKQGGAEFQDSLEQSKDFFRAVQVYIERMGANILTIRNLAGLSTRETIERPRRLVEA